MFAALSNLFAQSYSYGYSYSTPSTSSSLPGWVYFVLFAAIIIMIVSMWRLFTKAGQPGWAAIIPIYNTIVLLKIAGRPAWWFLLFLLPVVSIIVAAVVYYEVAQAFGKGVGYAVLLFLLPVIGFPMLAFGDAKYQGAPAK